MAIARESFRFQSETLSPHKKTDTPTSIGLGSDTGLANSAAQESENAESTEEESVRLWDCSHCYVTGASEVTRVIRARGCIIVIKGPVFTTEVDGRIICKGRTVVIKQTIIPSPAIAE